MNRKPNVFQLGLSREAVISAIIHDYIYSYHQGVSMWRPSSIYMNDVYFIKFVDL